MPTEVVIDIGNTRMKVALYVNGRMDGVLSFSNRAHKQLEILMENADVRRGILSNVSRLNKPLAKLFRRNPEIVNFNSKTKVPITLDYLTPNTLGTDRIANAVGALKKYPKRNILVIDFGTCIKYDVISEDGAYRGGAIAPGLAMRFKSMHRMTGKLPLIEQWTEREEQWPGKNTRSSMVSGVIQGINSEILRYIDLAQDQYQNLEVIATGGDFAFFDKAFKNIIFANPYLTLEGLHEIFLHNVE